MQSWKRTTTIARANEGARERERGTSDRYYDEIAAHRAMRGTIELPRALNARRRWLARPRRRARRGELSDERVARLEALGVTFELRKDVRAVGGRMSFEERVRELASARAGGTERDAALSKWVSHQVAAYRDGTLSEERYETLRDLGVDFDVEERAVRRWDERLAALEAHARLRGDCRPGEDAEDGLYFWLLDQRRAKRDGRLSPERVEALEALGVEWDVATRVHTKWEDRLEETRAFYQANKRLPRSSEDETLYQWIRRQRRLLRDGSLEMERERALDEAYGEEWRVKPSESEVY